MFGRAILSPRFAPLSAAFAWSVPAQLHMHEQRSWTTDVEPPFEIGGLPSEQLLRWRAMPSDDVKRHANKLRHAPKNSPKSSTSRASGGCLPCPRRPKRSCRRFTARQWIQHGYSLDRQVCMPLALFSDALCVRSIWVSSRHLHDRAGTVRGSHLCPELTDCNGRGQTRPLTT